MEITIKDKVYTIKYTLRALMVFEQLTDKMFEIKTLTDEYIFLYSLLIANNKDLNLSFDKLIDILDEDPSIMKTYQNFIVDEMDKQKQFQHSSEDSDDKKKL